MNDRYDPKNSFYVKFKYLPKHELQEALKTVDKLTVAGRTMSKREFMEYWESHTY